MNVLFFIKPKCETTYLLEDFTLRQALEKFKFHKFTTVPIIDNKGKYKGVLTEGDILWYILKYNLNMQELENTPLTKIKKRFKYKSCMYKDKINDIFDCAKNQNFVPILDDENNYLGLITRSKIIEYLNIISKNKINNIY